MKLWEIGYLAFIVFLIYALSSLMGGCVSLGPSDWPAEKHVLMARTCKVICHPGGAKGYDATAGECRCYQRRDRDE
jgi:hypothetical protein